MGLNLPEDGPKPFSGSVPFTPKKSIAVNFHSRHGGLASRTTHLAPYGDQLHEFSPLQRTRYVGWLLRVNRLFGTDKALRSGREFARVFRHDGETPLAPSHVTRWENGQLVTGHGILRRYEHLLGIAPELLVSLNDAMARLDGVDTSKYFVAREDNDRMREDLHRLLERARTPAAMSGAQWSYLTELVALQPNLVLHPPSLWRDLAGQLLSELSVAVFGEWWQRQEAMSRLLQHPHASPHAIAACIELANDPDSPVVIEPMSLLEAANHPVSNHYILDQVGNPNDHRALHGALLALVRKVSQGISKARNGQRSCGTSPGTSATPQRIPHCCHSSPPSGSCWHDGTLTPRPCTASSDSSERSRRITHQPHRNPGGHSSSLWPVSRSARPLKAILVPTMSSLA